MINLCLDHSFYIMIGYWYLEVDFIVLPKSNLDQYSWNVIVFVLKYHKSFIIVGIWDRGWKGIKFCLMCNDGSWRQDMGIAILVARTALTLTLLYLRQVIIIMSVSPLPCNIVLPYLFLSLLMEGTCPY